MGKFCANCGSQLDDGDKVCGQCGTLVAGAAPAAALTGTNVEKAKGGNKILKIAAAVIVLIVVAVIAANVAGNYTGIKESLTRWLRHFNKMMLLC